MTQDGRLATPLAILLGFGLLSLTVWRAGVRVGEAVDAAGLTSSTAPASTSATGLVSQPAPPLALAPAAERAPSSPDQEHGLRDEAQDALVRQAAEYRRRCAERVAATTPPEHGVFQVELRFDAQGLEVSRSFRADGPWPAPNWLACTKEQKLPPLRVTSIGRAATVTAQLALP